MAFLLPGRSSAQKRLGSRDGCANLFAMNCIVTAGPTYEPLDEVRRLTSFSTGRLGTELANYLGARGHRVSLLIGQQATFQGEHRAPWVETFTTTADLRRRLRGFGSERADAVFHAAAVSDFMFGKIWCRSPQGELIEIKSGKIPSRQGPLTAELVPTPKIIAELRDWFPKARLVGWKYEVDGDRAGVIRLAEEQIRQCRTDACVANGPAYGEGWGLATLECCTHLEQAPALCAALEEFIRR